MLEKIKKFIKNNYKYILFCAVFLAINSFFILRIHNTIGGWRFLLVASLLVVQLVLCILGYYLYRVRNWQPHRLFLLFSIAIGLMYVFVMPPGTAPDEYNHFRRAYEISEFKFISTRAETDGEGGDYLPESINELFSIWPTDVRYSNIPEIASKANQPSDDVFQNFGNTALYSPVVYLPQSIGILIGRILHLPLFVIFYLARIFNLAFWIILGYYAIKKLPFGKNVLLLILFLPISMQAATSCQADAITNASTIALFAFVLNKISAPKLMTRKDYAISAILAVLVSMSKIVYLPFCFLLLLLPGKCFKDNKEKWLKIGGLLLAIVTVNLLWLSISAGFLVEFREGVNSAEQVKFILTNPFKYLAIVGSSIAEQGTFYFFSFFGSSLAHFNIGLAEPYLLLLAFFIPYTYLQEDKNCLSTKQKVAITAISAVCAGLIFTSIYVQWTPVKNPLIEGIQGRYFIPLALPILFLIKPFASHAKKDFVLYTFAILSAINLYALASMLAYYMM